MRLTGTETGESLHDELAEMSASMLPEALDDIEAGVAAEMPQDDSQATYCRLIRKSDGVIDFTGAAGHLERKVRAYHPWPGAFTVLPLSSGGSERATLTRVEVAGGDGEPGEVIGAEGGRLEIACGVGSLRVLDLRPAGKRAMTAAEFLRGHHVEEGGLACAPR